MQLGRVVGTVVATRKSESLVGNKLLITQPIDIDSKPSGKPIIAVDTVGAGIGEVVLYATGAASRNAADKKNAAIDAAIVGIVDNMDVYKEYIDK
ncbi:MAG: EutN/CcmL family microcompartment protein [Tissierellales bacterium]